MLELSLRQIMPVETGPTLYLPYSQTYELGYLAWRRPEFIEYFNRHRIQLPLHKGDAVFFNPAMMSANADGRFVHKDGTAYPEPHR